MTIKFPFFPQHDSMDCGPACLRMVAQYYGRHYTLETLRQKCHISREGVSLLGISEAAEGIGFKTVGVHIGFEQLKEEQPLPCIVHWKQRHFVVVYKIRKDHVYVADPAHGLVKFSTREFLNGWISTTENVTEEGSILWNALDNNGNKVAVGVYVVVTEVFNFDGVVKQFKNAAVVVT